MYIVSRGRLGSVVLGNSSIQNRNVHPRLCLLKFLHERLDRFEAFQVDLHHLDFGRLELLPNSLGSRLSLLHIPHSDDHSRLVLRVQPRGLETNPGVSPGYKNRLAGKVNIRRDLWDTGRELFETEGDRSVRMEAECVLVGEAECEGRQEQHVYGRFGWW